MDTIANLGACVVQLYETTAMKALIPGKFIDPFSTWEIMLHLELPATNGARGSDGIRAKSMPNKPL